MTDKPENDQHATIDERIRNLRGKVAEGQVNAHPVNQAHIAWRMVIDLVAGVGVGAAAGYGLDYLFGTLPILMATFTLLGLAAGVNLMLRTAKEVSSSVQADGKGNDMAGSSDMERNNRGDQSGS